MMGAAGFSETSVLTSGQRVFPRSVPVLLKMLIMLPEAVLGCGMAMTSYSHGRG